MTEEVLIESVSEVMTDCTCRNLLLVSGGKRLLQNAESVHRVSLDRHYQQIILSTHAQIERKKESNFATVTGTSHRQQ